MVNEQYLYLSLNVDDLIHCVDQKLRMVYVIITYEMWSTIFVKKHLCTNYC